MWGLSEQARVYVYSAAVDFRKSIDGLVAIIESLGLEVFMAACYVFSNRRRDKVKIVYWDRNGFWLCYKRLEQQRFVWPKAEQAVLTLSLEQLQWLLSGIDLKAMRGHQALQYQRAS